MIYFPLLFPTCFYPTGNFLFSLMFIVDCDTLSSEISAYEFVDLE